MNLSTHFKRKEFACSCGCGFDTIDTETLDALEALRKLVNEPIIITSAARCVDYNRSIGSKDTSQHIKGRAVDVVVKNHHPEQIAEILDDLFSDKYGIGTYSDFVHLDTRANKARWVK